MTTYDLRDVHARLTRTLEALTDGDGLLAEQVLDDLTADVWRLIEEAEKGGGRR